MHSFIGHVEMAWRSFRCEDFFASSVAGAIAALGHAADARVAQLTGVAPLAIHDEIRHMSDQ